MPAYLPAACCSVHMKCKQETVAASSRAAAQHAHTSANMPREAHSPLALPQRYREAARRMAQIRCCQRGTQRRASSGEAAPPPANRRPSAPAARAERRRTGAGNAGYVRRARLFPPSRRAHAASGTEVVKPSRHIQQMLDPAGNVQIGSCRLSVLQAGNIPAAAVAQKNRSSFCQQPCQRRFFFVQTLRDFDMLRNNNQVI